MFNQAEANGISKQEFDALVNEFNATDDVSLLGHRLDQLFEENVDKFPNHVALIHDGSEVSFQELDISANLLARCLEKRGVQHGDVIGLAVSRSIDLVVVIIAVLKQGAAYVPIDPSFPAERINQMVEDAQPKYILSDCVTKGLALWSDICLSVGELRDDLITDTTNIEAEIQVRDAAYIIYTSGSTGRPKGVEISHGAACNFLGSLQKHEPGCNENDRLLAITTISFDMSTLELLLPLVSGATMIIANPSAVKDPRELIGLMENHHPTILQATPATWTMLLESGWNGEPRLSKIICGGEPLPRSLADRLLPFADSVWNVYGPCETTYGSVGQIGKGDITVGRPISNGRIYILDAHMSPVPIGREGEVYIGGGSVSNGYRNKPELTQSRFLRNPFHCGLFFRTGDLGRFIGPGKLQVVGRIDGVVKVRGHRIEVGDIEAVLVGHPKVSEAVVTSLDDRLVAYCVPDASFDAAASLQSILRQWVSERLPPYMVPAFFVQMDALPLSPNEKINYKALPDPLKLIQAQTTIGPASELEQQILAIWSAILGHDSIGMEDNFFNIGGDSVRVVRIQAALEKEFRRPVPTPKLFEHFTIKALAAYLATAGEETAEQPSPVNRGNFVQSDGEIAVVSMACRLPGGVMTPEDFYQLLQTGSDAIVDVPNDRWGAQKLYNADPDVEGTSYCSRGGFIHSIYSYDSSFFGISPNEAREMDPTQHLMLELGWEAFERAGYTKDKLSGITTGVFIGASSNVSTSHTVPELNGYSITGSASATLSGRLSYIFDLQGPSLTVDTACSASLVATHLACTALRQGECEVALVGGVSLLLTPDIHIEFSKLRALSADGRCKAFSDDTDGTGFSDGAAVVVLKPLSDAQRDGDDILAVLRGTTVMHGGHGSGLTVPSSLGQARLIRASLDRAGILPDDIDYVETHGTATKLGDAIEAAALAQVFGSRRRSSGTLLLGSAKSNIGHTGAASGLVGLLKVILSLQNRALPKTLHVSKPTRAVDWENTNMELVLENRPWQRTRGQPRRAGVSSFGIGGTNAHLIVEEPETAIPSMDDNPILAIPEAATSFPFVLSGKTESALRAQAGKLWLHLESGAGKDSRLQDIAYSLATSRTHFQHRSVVMATSKDQLLEQLMSISSSSVELPDIDTAGKGPLGMLFTGQGSQYPGMGKDLYSAYPVFRDTLDEIASNFTELELPILDVMWAEPGSEEAAFLARTDFAQPALFALETSLCKLWRSWGVEPSFLLGHSVGEIAAAYVAGVFRLSDACRLVTRRGRLMQALGRRGKMASIEASRVEITTTIHELNYTGQVAIASYNTPSQTVISGDAEAVDGVVTYMVQVGRRTKSLGGRRAFHSHHMNGILEDLGAVARTVHFSPPKIPMISSMTGRLVRAGELERAEYWVQQARQSVNFRDAFQELLNQGANIFVEVGPSPTLCGLGASCLAVASPARTALWLPSLKPAVDGISVIQNNVAELHVRYLAIDWHSYFRSFHCQRVALPTYAFQREAVQRTNDTYSRFSRMLHSVCAEKVTHGCVEEIMLERNWRQVSAAPIQPYGSWGVICPSKETMWATEAQILISRNYMQLVPVASLQDAQQLDGVIVLWDSDDDVVKMAYDLTTEALSQLQETIRTGFSMPLVWVTRHSLTVSSSDQPTRVGAGPLWGLLRTARSEHPDLCLRCIDMDEETKLDTLVLALMLIDEPEVAVRKEKLLVPHIERAPVVASPLSTQRLLAGDGAVLITGGLGHIASHLAQSLIKLHGIHDLVLMSRRGVDSPGADARVAELAELGGTATIVGGDVADIEAVSAVMKLFTADRPLRGVIHAAGVVDSGTLSSLTAEKLGVTLSPKVDGLWNLHQLTKGMDLEFFVMLSSISGAVGLPGLANYAAANCFMDGIASLRRAQGLPATSVAYGPWGGEGMATTLLPTTRNHISQLGLGLITPEIGFSLLEQAVYHGHPVNIAAMLDLKQLKAYYEEQGGIPRSLQSMLGPARTEKPANQPVNLRRELIAAAPERHGSIVLRMVQATIAKALGHTTIDDLDSRRPLQELGIDSLSAILIRNHLATMTGIALPPGIALVHPNLEALSDFLLSQLIRTAERTSSSEPETGCATPDTSGAASPSSNLAAIRKGLLDPSIQFDNVSQHTGSVTPQNVLVTGSTGFVGAFMVHELLTRGIIVHCLVRATSLHHAQERLIGTLKNYGLWVPGYEPLLIPVLGNLTQPLLGLSQAIFDDLASRIDTIAHSGALVDWMRPLEDYVGPNILGTHEILRLASSGQSKAVHFISTISTLPIHAGYGLTEHSSEYGYGTSKYLAEQLIVAARFRGARASSYRLPLVAASASNGHFRLDRGDFLHSLIAGSLDLGVFPSIDADLSAVLPVDYLCDTIAAIMTEDQGRIGVDYDFVNPHAHTCNDLFATLCRCSDGKGVVSFSDWHRQATEYASANPGSPLARIATVIDGYTDETAGALIKGSPVGKHILGLDLYPAPALDELYVCKYLECINSTKA